MIKKIFRVFREKLLNGLTIRIDSLLADNALLKEQRVELQERVSHNFDMLSELLREHQRLVIENQQAFVLLETKLEKINSQYTELVELVNMKFTEINTNENLNVVITRLGELSSSISNLGEGSHVQFSILQNKVNSLLTRQLTIKKPNKSNKIRVLFIIHNMYTWAALDLIYRNLWQRQDSEVFVLAIQSQESDSGIRQSYSSKTKIFLEKANIRFHSIDDRDVYSFIAYLTAISPDYIIRQSGWDSDIPELYSSLNLSNYKIVYIPYYSLDVVDDFSPDKLNLEYNQNFHLHCYKIYGVSNEFVTKAKEIYLADPGKFKFLGNTKLEYLSKKVKEHNHFINSGIANIIWAPHHSINGQWLAFGTFEKNCMDFITLAKNYGDRIHIKFRPHPLLKNSMYSFDANLWNNFIEEWNALPNTSIDEEWDYTKSFEWSDLMVTDGISFIAEYPLTNKPIIYIESETHLEFNNNGVLSKNCCYVAKDSSELFYLIERFFEQDLPYKADYVEILRNELCIDNASERIVNDLLGTSDE